MTKLQLGTARITDEGLAFVVRWMNHGNFLSNEPRCFNSEQGAREFCRQRGLRIVR